MKTTSGVYLDNDLKKQVMEKAKAEHITSISALVTKLFVEYVRGEAEAHAKPVGRPAATEDEKKARSLAKELTEILARAVEIYPLSVADSRGVAHSNAHGFCHDAIDALDLKRLELIFELALWNPRNYKVWRETKEKRNA